jgi:hypothetical protein
MKRLSFCLAILLILSFGVANAQPPGDVFLRLGTVSLSAGVIAGDTLKVTPAGATFSLPIITGNRDTVRYNPSHAVLIYGASTNLGARASGTANWGFATTNGGNYDFSPATAGVWLDTTGNYPKDDFGALFRFNCFGCNGTGVDTIAFGGAANDLAQNCMRPKDSAVFFVVKLDIQQADTGQWVCIDSSDRYPPTLTWKWASFGLDPLAVPPIPNYSAFPTWSGAKCWIIGKLLNQSPIIGNCPPSGLTGSHCNAFSHQFTATDPEGNSPLVWSLVS